MSRFRLAPTPEQEAALLEHCAHARFVWNLAVEQQSWWRPGRKSAPGWAERGKQLTEARTEFGWLRSGSQVVQQQALRDFGECMDRFFSGIQHKPGYRKAIRSEGFRVVGRRGDGGGYTWNVRRISRHVGEVRIPKVGWVRFRWSRKVPDDAKSYRVTLDRSGRWHIAFAAVPEVIPASGTGEAVGIDRGVAVSAALSTGEMLTVPGLSPGRARRLVRLQRKLSRAKRGSKRRGKVRLSVARLRAREKDARKDWTEKLSTDIARRFDVIRVEDLKIGNMIRSARGTIEKPGRNVAAKAGLNREIQRSGWGLLVRRLEQKAPGRVEKINPAFTSQRCSACGTTDREARESQAVFRCQSCGFACNADVNAAKNIAAGHAVTARGGSQLEPVNREPQAA